MNKLFLLKRTLVFKVLAVFVAFSFLTNTAGVAGPVISSRGYSSVELQPAIKLDKITNLFIPENFGTITKKWIPETISNNKMVIHIQDAHCNYEAQTNISKILEVLIRDYKVDLVCVEGAEGFVDTSKFSSNADQKTRETVADKYVKKGYLSASEALSIGKGKGLPFTIYGVEDTKLYLENFKEFRNTISNREEAGRYIYVLNNLINTLIPRLYNEKLQEFHTKATAYQNNELSLSDWVKFLAEQEIEDRRQMADKKNFKFVLKSIKLEEKIDFKKVEQERASLINKLEKQLTKEDLRVLIEKSLLLKLGKIPSVDYYNYLEQYLPTIHNPQSTIYLQTYIHLLKLQSRIDSEKLFNEMEEIENEIKDRLYTNQIERGLDKIAKDVQILNKLYNLNLTKKELGYYENHKQEFYPPNMLSFILVQARAQNINIPEELDDKKFLNKVEEFMKPGEEFYRQALERDDVLVKKLLEKMDKDNKNVAVIVNGGFHSDGVIQRLKDKNISYVVISPKITKIQKENPYLDIMMDKNIDIEKVIDEIGNKNLARALILGNIEELFRTGKYEELKEALQDAENIGVDLKDIFKGDLAPENLITAIKNEQNDTTASFYAEILEIAITINENKTSEEAKKEVGEIMKARQFGEPPDMAVERELREVSDYFQINNPEDIRAKTGQYGEMAEAYSRVTAREYFNSTAGTRLTESNRNVALGELSEIARKIAGHFSKDGYKVDTVDGRLKLAARAQHVGYVSGVLNREFGIDEEKARNALNEYFDNNGNIDIIRSLGVADEYLKNNGWMFMGGLDDNGNWSFWGFGATDVALNLPGVYAGAATVNFANALTNGEGEELLNRLLSRSAEEMADLLQGKGDAKEAALAAFAARAAQLGWLVSKLGQGIVEAHNPKKEANSVKRWAPKNDLITTFNTMAKNKGWTEVAKDIDQIKSYAWHEKIFAKESPAKAAGAKAGKAGTPIVLENQYNGTLIDRDGKRVLKFAADNLYGDLMNFFAIMLRGMAVDGVNYVEGTFNGTTIAMTVAGESYQDFETRFFAESEQRHKEWEASTEGQAYLKTAKAKKTEKERKLAEAKAEYARTKDSLAALENRTEATMKLFGEDWGYFSTWIERIKGVVTENFGKNPNVTNVHQVENVDANMRFLFGNTGTGGRLGIDDKEVADAIQEALWADLAKVFEKAKALYVAGAAGEMPMSTAEAGAEAGEKKPDMAMMELEAQLKLYDGVVEYLINQNPWLKDVKVGMRAFYQYIGDAYKRLIKLGMDDQQIRNALNAALREAEMNIKEGQKSVNEILQTVEPANTAATAKAAGAKAGAVEDEVPVWNNTSSDPSEWSDYYEQKVSLLGAGYAMTIRELKGDRVEISISLPNITEVKGTVDSRDKTYRQFLARLQHDLSNFGEAWGAPERTARKGLSQFAKYLNSIAETVANASGVKDGKESPDMAVPQAAGAMAGEESALLDSFAGNDAGSALHSDWQATYRRDNPTAKDRWKAVKNTAWAAGKVAELRLMPGDTKGTVRMTADGKVEIDILNMGFNELSPDWQAENGAAGNYIMELLKEAVRKGIGLSELNNAVLEAINILKDGKSLDESFGMGSSVKTFIIDAGTRIHSAWLERNAWAQSDETLKKPFLQLPAKEQIKDINQLNVILNMLLSEQAIIEAVGAEEAGKDVPEIKDTIIEKNWEIKFAQELADRGLLKNWVEGTTLFGKGDLIESIHNIILQINIADSDLRKIIDGFYSQIEKIALSNNMKDDEERQHSFHLYLITILYDLIMLRESRLITLTKYKKDYGEHAKQTDDFYINHFHPVDSLCATIKQKGLNEYQIAEKEVIKRGQKSVGEPSAPVGAKAGEPSPDMRVRTGEVPHETENEWLEKEHLKGNTLFMKNGEVYEVVFEEGKPKLDENGNYILEEVTDSEYTKWAVGLQKSWDILLKGSLFRKGQIDILLDSLGISNKEDRDYIRDTLARKGLTFVMVKGQTGLGIFGDIFSHAGRSRVQITIGEYLLEELMQMKKNEEEIKRVMFEELKHVIRDIYNDKNKLDRNTGQAHVNKVAEQKDKKGIWHNPEVVNMLRDLDKTAREIHPDIEISIAQSNSSKMEELIKRGEKSGIWDDLKIIPADMIEYGKRIFNAIIPGFYYLNDREKDRIARLIILHIIGMYPYKEGGKGEMIKQAILITEFDPDNAKLKREIEIRKRQDDAISEMEGWFLTKFVSDIGFQKKLFETLGLTFSDAMAKITSQNCSLKELIEAIDFLLTNFYLLSEQEQRIVERYIDLLDKPVFEWGVTTALSNLTQKNNFREKLQRAKTPYTGISPDMAAKRDAIVLDNFKQLMQDIGFSEEIAEHINNDHNAKKGYPVGPLYSESDKTAKLEFSKADEAIAMDLAGFYALETGIGLLAERNKGKTFIDILRSIVDGTISKEDMLVIARFANATWKAGQPFRSLNRITRNNFIPAVLLPTSELEKDFVQIKASAQKLYERMKGLEGRSNDEQLKELSTILKDKSFAVEMAQWLNSAYYMGLNKQDMEKNVIQSNDELKGSLAKISKDLSLDADGVKEYIVERTVDGVQIFVSSNNGKKILMGKIVYITDSMKKNPAGRTKAQEQVAMNLAGFYALETGIGLLCEEQCKSFDEVLRSIVNGTISDRDMLVIARFANATWKAGQPFKALDLKKGLRGVDWITRDIFKPAVLLDDAELRKDFDQIHAAAEKLLKKMTTDEEQVDEYIKNLLDAAGQSKANIADDNLFKQIAFEGDDARLGWVNPNPPAWQDAEKQISEFDQKSKGKKNFIFIGMGGSINTVKALIELYGKESEYNIFALDSLDGKAIKDITEKIGDGWKDTIVIPISKSATTKETHTLADTLKEIFDNKQLDYREHFMWMIDIPNKAKLGNIWSECPVMSIQPDEKTDIGGRFTAPFTMIYLLPLFLMFNGDMSLVKTEYNRFIKQFENIILEAVKKAMELHNQYFAVRTSQKNALNTWITQLIQESLGSKKEGYNPKTIVLDPSESIPDGFSIIEVPQGETPAQTMMLTAYYLQNLVAMIAYLENINFVNQPMVELYKKEAKILEGEQLPEIERVDIAGLIGNIKSNLKPGQRFIEVVVYANRQPSFYEYIKNQIQKEFPGRIVLVFEGSDWNHHSYQGVIGSQDTLFTIITADKYADDVKGVSRDTLVKNSETLKRFAYATYETIKDKALICSMDFTEIKFGTSGWRGKIGEDFNIDNIRKCTQGVADYYKKHLGKGNILLGYDPREGNKNFIIEIASILAGNNIPVLIIEEEPTPTPVLAYLANTDDEIVGVINLTASHNKYSDGGFKFSPYHGGAADDQTTKLISKYANDVTDYKKADYSNAKSNGLITELKLDYIVEKYVNDYIILKLKEAGAWNSIVSYIETHPDFKVVLDPMQGTSVEYLRAIFDALSKDAGRNFYQMLHENNKDTRFSQVNSAPNPTEAGNIKPALDEIAKDENTIGLLVDGDTDRFGIIDFGGKEINANQIMAALVYFLAGKGFTGKVGKTVATSNFVNAVAKYRGLDLTETEVGYKYGVLETIKNHIDFLLFGEESAHVGTCLFPNSWDDGIGIILTCLWMLADTGKGMSDYINEIENTIGKRFIYKRTSMVLTPALKQAADQLIEIAKEEKQEDKLVNEMEIVKKINDICAYLKADKNLQVEEVITKDGVKVVFNDGTWFCIRLSGTEDVARLYTEGINSEETEQIMFKIGKILLGIETMEEEEPTTVQAGVEKLNVGQKRGVPAIIRSVLDAIKRAVFDLRKNREDIARLLMKWVNSIERDTSKRSGRKFSESLAESIEEYLYQVYKYLPLNLLKSKAVSYILRKEITVFGVRIATVNDNEVVSVEFDMAKAIQIIKKLADYIEKIKRKIAKRVVAASARAVSDLRGSKKEEFSDMLVRSVKSFLQDHPSQRYMLDFVASLNIDIMDFLHETYRLYIDLWPREVVDIQNNKLTFFGVPVATVQGLHIISVGIDLAKAKQITEKLADYIEKLAGVKRQPAEATESPDMRVRTGRVRTGEVPHEVENEWLEKEHLKRNTLFIKNGMVNEIVFKNGKPQLDENGNYILQEVTDSEYADWAVKLQKLWDILLKGALFRKGQIEPLLDNLGILETGDRKDIKEALERTGLTFVMVKGHAGLGIFGDIFSHAGRSRVQITVGEYLLEQLMQMQKSEEEIKKVMLEELKHVIRDIYNQKYGLNRKTGQAHVTDKDNKNGIWHDPDVVEMLIRLNTEARRIHTETLYGMEKLIEERGTWDALRELPKDMVAKISDFLRTAVPGYFYLDNIQKDKIARITLLEIMGRYKYTGTGIDYKRAVNLAYDPFIFFIKFKETIKSDIEADNKNKGIQALDDGRLIKDSEKAFWKKIIFNAIGVKYQPNDRLLEYVIIGIYSQTRNFGELREYAMRYNADPNQPELIKLVKDLIDKYFKNTYNLKGAIKEIRLWIINDEFINKFISDMEFQKELSKSLGLDFNDAMAKLIINLTSQKKCPLDELIEAIDFLLTNFYLLSEPEQKIVKRYIDFLDRQVVTWGTTTTLSNLTQKNHFRERLQRAETPHTNISPDISAKLQTNKEPRASVMQVLVSYGIMAVLYTINALFPIVISYVRIVIGLFYNSVVIGWFGLLAVFYFFKYDILGKVLHIDPNLLEARKIIKRFKGKVILNRYADVYDVYNLLRPEGFTDEEWQAVRCYLHLISIETSLSGITYRVTLNPKPTKSSDMSVRTGGVSERIKKKFGYRKVTRGFDKYANKTYTPGRTDRDSPPTRDATNISGETDRDSAKANMERLLNDLSSNIADIVNKLSSTGLKIDIDEIGTALRKVIDEKTKIELKDILENAIKLEIDPAELIQIGIEISRLRSLDELVKCGVIAQPGAMVNAVLEELVREMGGEAKDPEKEFREILRKEFGIAEAESMDFYSLIEQLMHILEFTPDVIIDTDFYKSINILSRALGTNETEQKRWEQRLLRACGRGMAKYQVEEVAGIQIQQLEENLKNRNKKLLQELQKLLANKSLGEILLDAKKGEIPDKDLEKYLIQLIQAKNLETKLNNINDLINSVQNPQRMTQEENLDSPFYDFYKRFEFYLALKNKESTDKYLEFTSLIDFFNMEVVPEGDETDSTARVGRASEANVIVRNLQKLAETLGAKMDNTPRISNISIDAVFPEWDSFIQDAKKGGKVNLKYMPGLAAFFSKLPSNEIVILRAEGLDEIVFKNMTKRDLIQKLIRASGIIGDGRILVEEELKSAQDCLDKRGDLQTRYGAKEENIVFLTTKDFTAYVSKDTTIQNAITSNKLKIFGIEKGSPLPLLLLLGHMAASMNIFDENQVLSEAMKQVLIQLGMDIIQTGTVFIKIRLIRIKEILQEYRLRSIVVDIAA